MKQLLVLARPDDLHADAVVDIAGQRGLASLRFDPETLFSARENLSIYIDNQSFSVRLFSKSIEAEVGAVFCRNWSFPKPLEQDPLEIHLQRHETRAATFGMLVSLGDKYWMNPPWKEDRVDNKILQTREASAFGLKVPKTLVTNVPEEAKKFWDMLDGNVVIKQLSEISLIDNNELSEENYLAIPRAYGFYTKQVLRDDIHHFEEIRNAPCLLQELIPKRADIRVTVVGDEVFAHLIDSQPSQESRIDFRRVIDLRTEPFVFPHDIAVRLKAMLQSWGIFYAACDFALTPEGELIFFEANVTGNWLWLENKDSHPILDAVVAKLQAACE
jgi:glutathione synthase/RimK-type ligase-like ATP-grasp enzyme